MKAGLTSYTILPQIVNGKKISWPKFNIHHNIIIIILYFRHLSIYTIKHNYKKYIHTIKNKYITGKNNY